MVANIGGYSHACSTQMRSPLPLPGALIVQASGLPFMKSTTCSMSCLKTFLVDCVEQLILGPAYNEWAYKDVCTYQQIYIYIYGTPPVIYLFWGKLRKCLGFRAEVGQSALFFTVDFQVFRV